MKTTESSNTWNDIALLHCPENQHRAWSMLSHQTGMPSSPVCRAMFAQLERCSRHMLDPNALFFKHPSAFTACELEQLTCRILPEIEAGYFTREPLIWFARVLIPNPNGVSYYGSFGPFLQPFRIWAMNRFDCRHPMFFALFLMLFQQVLFITGEDQEWSDLASIIIKDIGNPELIDLFANSLRWDQNDF